MNLKRLLLILMAMGLFIVACGGAETPDEPAADDPEPVAEATEAPEPTPVPEPTATPVVVDELVCEDAIGCVEVAAGDPVRVASALVVTGPNESLGLDSQYGVEIAIKDRGDLFGHEIELQAEDDGCSAEGGQIAGQKIVSDPSIAGIIGTSCSGAGVPMSQIACESGYAMISPSNTSPALTAEGSRQPCYFRTAHNDLIQGAAMANFVFNELGLTQAAAIHDGDPYTEGLATAFTDAFAALGGEIVAFEAEAADATNVEPLLTSVAAAEPEFIFAPVFIPLGSLIVKTAQEIDGLEGVILAAADGVLSPDFLEAAGDAAEGMYLSGPDLSFGNSIYDAFLATYNADYGTDPISAFHAHAYDATNMLLDGIAAVAQVDGDGNMLIGRQALIDQLGTTSGMAGITGTITCDAFGDCADPKIAVNQVIDGAFTPLWNDIDGMLGMMDDEMMEDDGMMDDGMMAGNMVDELSCDDAIGCVEIAAGDAMRVASALVVTGPNESLGLDSQYGVEIAIKQRGQVLGLDVELQAEDDGCSAEGGQIAGQKIVSDPSIVGVIGTSCSGAGVPMSQILCDSGVAMISPSNTAPVLTGADTRQSCYFRTAHNDRIQGAAMASFVINELGLTKAAAIHDGDPYTEGLASAFSDAFVELGGEIVAFEAEAADATNVEPLLTSVAAAGPEIIFSPVFIPLGSLIAKTAAEIDGLEGVVLAAADGVLSPDFIEAAGDSSEGMYLSGPDLSFGNAIYDEFLAIYEADYGTSPISAFHAHAYDATNMLLNAIEHVAQIDPDGNVLIGRQALIDRLGETSGMDGITGTITCDEFGDCADPQIAVNEVVGGEFNPIWSDSSSMMDDDAMMGEMMPVSVCEVTDVGGIDDNSFNATAWAGAQEAASITGGNAQFLESQQQTDYERNIGAFIEEGCDLIVTVGFLLGDATTAAAEANPDQKFSIIDSVVDSPNVVSQLYAIDQAAFLAGYVAASATETGIVGTFGGINIPPVTQFMDGFVFGVNYYNEENGTDVQVLGWDVDAQDGLFTGNFDSTDDGRTLGESLMDEGADIILPVAGPVGLGTAAAAQERGNAWIIGVDTDWTASAPDFADIILTSIMKRMDVSVVEVAKQVGSGEFAGGIFLSNLENGGVSITDGPYDVDIQPLIDGIIAGEIQTAP